MVDTSPRRWMRVGGSAGFDDGAAGEEAAGQALGQDKASLVVVFCSDAYDLEQLIRTISERSGGAPLIGCSTAGEIGVSGPGDASVIVTALGGEGVSIATALANHAPRR